MPKNTATAKIEDTLGGLKNLPVTYDSNSNHFIEPPVESISFPEILDYTFPDEVPDSNMVQIGEITYVGDGVCHVSGLDQAKIDEVISIKTSHGSQHALIFGISENQVEAVVLGDYVQIKRGQVVHSSGQKLKTPVGKPLLGRVINPLGEPLDGAGNLSSTEHHDVEFPSPGVVDRDPVTQPLHTGILSIDTTIPIGRGQRELVIGDRKTGKSRTMLDIICNQAGQKVMCIYVGIGIQAAKAKATYEYLKAHQALSYTTLVIALSDDPPSLQYLAPFVGTALGEYYMYNGGDALVIFDDLSKQAKAYRQVSLLLKRSPGRDAYPGDIFFLHSRLLERASQLSKNFGGGSLTALPVAETQSGDISDYIITNLMSITDGHIYLDANLMHEGLMPAINSGASVSRIGGKVQTKLLQKVGELSGRILARFEEVKSYETINTEVSQETVTEINRGKRIKELFAQDSKVNFTAEEEVIFLGLAVLPYMDNWTIDQVRIYKNQFPAFLKQSIPPESKPLLNRAQKLEEVSSILNPLFDRFCHLNKLPMIPTTAL